MKLRKLVVGVYAANCYILSDENTAECAVIDPGGDLNDILKVIDASKCKVKYILLTHGHADHMEAAEQVKSRYNAPIGINKLDYEMIQRGELMYGTMTEEPDIYFKDNQIFEIGDMKLKVVFTPGHTPGGVSFLVENLAFTGDTLFQGSVGRTDFAGGDYNTIIASIKNRLMVLPDETEVLPGHGLKSFIGKEKIYNSFLQ
ncbi:MBL fold metallo-hydrolase [Clostridium luticellarii]|jgi:glyoxylase-like metal-dependent hydrolase (beta-lactamase superfamily II)|uniref:Beta-lactamase hydrolase-like protein n=1 Tax=Clostridium luticellarii TaxID=1691940 RepID=A0A2T0BLL7_9CLOT|nr:MBL fold metallo-hydrolase [Clostridium luticellarii]MCI1944286.1 MBL fold metallo-hydrolase [Clostridium luticellarii]MCI1967782.1 MBL fold metallo-hydrolase [Clostridium luticellarii]MCI1994660.1 MBL fold metallo-hydrolase [Clostridium luticellarii]MCI2038843.1 MBL fold metallo-hydrolase [Clostridium luticellarii]PRR84790.1 Beta-lactamase hydrolase-like protein [Clostridium luticellarii]